MHIPSSTTDKIEVATFEAARLCAEQPSATYDVEKWLFVPNTYDEYRYILGTRGKNPLICCGINPSTAAPENLDNTLKSAERIALHNGYDSFIMLNIYAQRATNPDDMEQKFNPLLHEENLKAFSYALTLCEGDAPTVWAAWGTIIEKRPFLQNCLRDFIEIGKEQHVHWVSAGKVSKKGHPHHPLYLRKDSGLDEFDMAAYEACFK